MPPLGTYKGRDVIQTGVAIRNAGDGLSQALGIEPRDFAFGETVYVVLECVMDGDDYVPIKDTETLKLVTVLKAGRATIIDAAAVKKALDDQEDRITKAREKAAGVERLPLDPADEE